MKMKIDMHVHSEYSIDGLSSPKELLENAKAKGIGFAITEHNNTDSWDRFRELNRQFNVPLIFGEEKKLYIEGKLVGEILFYFLQEPVVSKNLFEAIDEGKKQGAILSVAHPFDFLRKPVWFGFKKLEEVKTKVDAIEAFNARIYFQGLNKKAEKFALQNNLALTAGSDAHTPKELGNALAVAEAGSLEEFRNCLKKRQTRVEGRLAGFFVHLPSTLKQFGIIKVKKEA
ncbi:MAG: PHP domain-containing protein [Candidatus ainarchaeum sp.]|nr:PHP domain-containing protein [Candidatus ainarchaeum sp.]